MTRVLKKQTEQAQADSIARQEMGEELKQSQAELRAVKEEADLLRRNNDKISWQFRQLSKKTAQYERDVHKALCVLRTLRSDFGADAEDRMFRNV